MSTETHPPLGGDADAAPHDEYCTKALAMVPADLLTPESCLCSLFAMVRCDELLKVDHALVDLPKSTERDLARKVVNSRLLPLVMTALLPTGGK